MRRHEHFPDLVAHDDDEVAALLGARVVGRQTVHEWPLSWVQRIELDDGRTLAYKSQLPPTVEPGFCEAARSPLLPAFERLDDFGRCSTMVIDWIDAPRLDEVAIDEEAFVAHARRVAAQVVEVGGRNLPVYLDLGSPERWIAQAGCTDAKLRSVADAGLFASVSSRDVDTVAEWSRSERVVDAFAKGCRLAHGDLHADQIFVTPDSYRVIDWQRPLIGRAALDLALLLNDRGIDPLPHVDQVVVAIRWFLLLHWVVVAQHDIFPAYRGPDHGEWATTAITHITG